MIPGIQVYEWFNEREENTADLEALNWVLAHWPELSQLTMRAISATDLKTIQQQIQQISTGKQRLYRQALDQLLQYLAEVCFWSVPEKQKKQLIDREHRWFERLTGKAETAFLLLQQYEADRQSFIQERTSPSVAFVALTVATRVAPVSLTYLAQILNTPDKVSTQDTRTYLDIEHITGKYTDNKQLYVTRYDLDLFSYHVLQQYFAHISSSGYVTSKKLLNALNDYCKGRQYPLPLFSATDFHLTFQAIWHYHHHLGPTLLKDFSNPERHVAIPLDAHRQITRSAQQQIYKQDWDPHWYKKITAPIKLQWPHRELIRAFNHGQKPTIISERATWQSDNLLPEMLYRYTAELLQYGGVRKKTLAEGTIQNYTNIQHWLADHPLSHEVAIDSLQLQHWVRQLLASQTSEANRLILFYFLRFMQSQALTDHLSLAEFSPPFTPPSVDPRRVSLQQLNQILEMLLEAPSASPLQRLFSAVAMILSYHGMLRRSELLRLRYRDIQSLEEKGSKSRLFKLEITRTKEGSTKSRKSRTIHIALPVEQAKLVLVLLDLRKPHALNDRKASDEPLIGFQNEKMSSRNQFYLLPVTRALKAVAGPSVRFHHLRHSGVHLWFLQLMHLFYNQKPDKSLYDAFEQQLLSHEVTQKRLRYWLEGRPLTAINTSLVYDEFIRMIGHEDYATTRWSYLHGLEWLAPVMLSTQPEYTYPELRFLLGLSPKALLPERLKPWISECIAKGRKSSTFKVNDDALRQYLFSSSMQPRKDKQLVSNLDENHYLNLWLQQLVSKEKLRTLSDVLQTELIRQRNQLDESTFALLSVLWERWGCHQIEPLTKPQRTALSTLWAHQIETNDNKVFYQFAIQCNQQWAGIYQTIFAETELRLFDRQFTLALNRKTNPARQRVILEEQFVLGKEAISVIKHDPGKTQLLLSLSLPIEISDDCRNIIQQCIQNYLAQ